MLNVTLADLISKIRRITARPSTNQISDSAVVDYLNLFYEFDLPQSVKIFDFHTTYSFITQPNQDQYPLSQVNRSLYKSFDPPVFCSGYYCNWYQNRDQFFRFWPQLYTSAPLATSTGALGPYTGTLAGLPVLAGSVLVSVLGTSGVTLTAVDVGTGAGVGNLVDPSGTVLGTINYTTGAVTITWGAIDPPLPGVTITIKYTPYQASRPLAILYYDNVFTLRPIPDQAYKIEMQAYIQPFAVTPVADAHVEYSFLNTTTYPLLQDYFQLLAYGASLKIFADSLEMDNYKMIMPLYQEQLLLAERKTLMQIKTQRTQTIYSDSMFWGANRLPTS